ADAPFGRQVWRHGRNRELMKSGHRQAVLTGNEWVQAKYGIRRRAGGGDSTVTSIQATISCTNPTTDDLRRRRGNPGSIQAQCAKAHHSAELHCAGAKKMGAG
ncbi:MAG TPA: hypothetical protein VGO84_04610, partial [Burkholderiales bacterium]|nr:hypothetical protein [Burkholderiales bacterium]